MMLFDEIQEKIKIIEANKGNYEKAHELEDSLHTDVLLEIISGRLSKELCQTYAKEALKTKEIKFVRWCD